VRHRRNGTGIKGRAGTYGRGTGASGFC
jgi:hypothetical protein